MFDIIGLIKSGFKLSDKVLDKTVVDANIRPEVKAKTRRQKDIDEARGFRKKAKAWLKNLRL